MRANSSLTIAFSRILRFGIVCSLMLAVIAILPPRSVAAATPKTWVVTVTHDRTSNLCDAECTLREAYNYAAAGDTITFAANLTGAAIYLESPLAISKDVTIDGLQTGVTITSSIGIQLLGVASTVTLSNLILSGGSFVNGGAIYNSGNLMLNNVSLRNNAALNQISGNGGGVFNHGTLTVTRCAFSNNTAAGINGGSAIYTNAGVVTIIDSIFTQNTATGGGAVTNVGGILNISGSTFADNFGGAITNNGTLTVTNSTFSGNGGSFGGAIAANGGMAMINFSTIAGNTTYMAGYGGGIHVSAGTITLTNSIVANNAFRTPTDPTLISLNCSGTISGANNQANDPSCGAAAVISQTINLGTLGDHGGNTPTIPILSGSSAIDATGLCNVLADQRGVIRPQGASCDIGAYEYQPGLSISDVTQSEGNSGVTSFSFTASLSAAFSAPVTFTASTANNSAGGDDYVALAPTVFTIPAGSSSATIVVPVTGDLLYETDETFYVALSNPMNAVIADGQGLGTIINDDPLPTLSVADASLAEGGAGIFTVSLSAVSGLATTFLAGTAGDTATSGVDFSTLAAANYSIPAGESATTISIASLDDARAEGDETFTLVLSNPINASIADGEALGTIEDDDVAGILVHSAADLVTSEAGGAATFTVALASEPAADVRIDLSSSDLSEGIVFPLSITFTAADWNVPQTITVTGVDDLISDGDQPYRIVFQNAVSADAFYNRMSTAPLAVTNTNDETLRAIYLPFLCR